MLVISYDRFGSVISFIDVEILFTKGVFSGLPILSLILLAALFDWAWYAKFGDDEIFGQFLARWPSTLHRKHLGPSVPKKWRSQTLYTLF